LVHSATVRREKRPKMTPPAGAAAFRDDLTRAITLAALSEFAAHGYGGLSMEAVARRAGVGKAAVYRRWPGKDAMLVDVLGAGLEFVGAPDTGSLEGDLVHYVREAIAILRRPPTSKIMPHLYAAMNADSSFGRLIRSTIQPVKRDRAGDIIRRAIGRGELDASIDLELAFDILAGPLYWRLIVTHSEINDGYVEHLVAFMLAGLTGQGRAAGRPKTSGRERGVLSHSKG
jgi:AcrR family transcriptional regulator